MKTQAQIIKNAANGIFVKSLAERKGWSKQQTADSVLAWLTCGKNVSLHDYLVAL